MSLHCIRGCARRGQHLADCEDPSTCPGCEPRLATTGAYCDVCERGIRRALTELPTLWVDLAERPRLTGVDAIPAGEGHSPGLPMRGQAVDMRTLIRSWLTFWAKTLEQRHGLPAPDEAATATSTRSIARYHSELSRQARDAAALLAMPAVGPLQPNAVGYQSMKDDAARHALKAAAARSDRENDLDVIRALAEFVGRHLEALLAVDSEPSPQVLADIHHHARRVANPSRGANLRILCACGSRVQVDEAEIMTCPGCGNYGVVSWWVQQETAAETEPLTLAELHVWLIQKGVIIHERKLRDWADSGVITVIGGGNGQPRKFDPTAVLIIAKAPRRTRTPRTGVREVA